MSERSLGKLLDTDDPAWPLVCQWIADARNAVETLPVERTVGEQTLLFLQVTAHSPLGALALESGGIVIDHGWLRLLGAGSGRLQDGLCEWNQRAVAQIGERQARYPELCLVAHDAAGGFFALNGGAWDGRPSSVFYFAPDTLRWEDLGTSYSGFLQWALAGDLAQFYATMHWPEWERDVAAIADDQGYSIYPPLWMQGEPIADRSRQAVPMRELWGVQMDFARQLATVPDSTNVRIHVTDGE